MNAKVMRRFMGSPIVPGEPHLTPMPREKAPRGVSRGASLPADEPPSPSDWTSLFCQASAAIAVAAKAQMHLHFQDHWTMLLTFP